ncbi:MAG: phosphatidylserine decarboxylase family protein [Nitrospinae bacterium]|nr:phosphatidylserine decarboxylase family protein [Nitrospinota bacterium]
MRIPIARQGYPFIVPLGLLAGAFWALSMARAAAVFGGLFLFVVYFFRDPERTVPGDPKAVISPADGKVVEIVAENDPFTGKKSQRISIFLSVFNVHVNRIPVAGRVEKIRYNHGKFLAAFNHKASLDNEQNVLSVFNGRDRVAVKQIAGLIARRIVCWVREGDAVAAGQRFGLIRFGSRVDIFVPEDARLAVALGDRVRGGSSVIGFLQ